MMAITKRYNAPKFWRIKTKEKKFIVSLRVGPHNKKSAIPLLVIIRDILEYAHTAKEAKEIVKKGLIKINGVVRKDYKFPVGLMDILEMGTEYYMVLPHRKGLSIQPIKKTDAERRLVKIVRKKIVKKGRIQLGFHTGETMLVDDNSLKPGDVIILTTKDKKISDVLKFEVGNTAMVTTGRNIGVVGKIKEIIIERSSRPNRVVLDIEGRDVDVPMDYVFVVGKEKPVISIAKEL
ncbi:MAG: 30S ribosomal protein S4e [Candidatus Aenigmarchaeota archaeon ex4484_14]|nr:MAG: 30S ribosomal protein S4e [Candidatus Aenigmarchaeota archaeon ex4484_14]